MYRNREYQKSIEKLTDAIISIGLLDKKDNDNKLKRMRLKDMMLVAEGYQIRAYFELAEENPSKWNEIEKEMIKIARGTPTDDNLYYNKMCEVLEEYIKPGFWTGKK